MDNKIIPMTISYTGDVKLSYIRNGKVYESYHHNAGMPALFKLICKALAKKDVSGECPAYVDLRGSNDGVTYTSILAQKVPTSGGSYYQSSGDWLYGASASIPASNVSVSLVDDPFLYYRLYLLSEASGVELAHVSVESDDLKNITPGTQALVEWILRFQNPNGSQNS